MNHRINKDKALNHIRISDASKIPIYNGINSVGDEPGMEGDIIFDRNTLQFCFHNGMTWICLTTVTVTNAGMGCDESIIADGEGPFLSLKGINAGTGISLTSDSTCLTISTALTNASDLCDENILNDSGPDLTVKGINAGTGISLMSDASCITISTSLTNASDLCDENLLDDSGPALTVKGINAGTNVSLTSDASCVTISVPTPDLETVLLAGNMANGVDIDMTATTSLINTDDGMVRIGSNFDSGQLLSNSPIEPVGVGGAGLSIYSGSTDTAGRFLFVASAGSTTGTGQIVFANPYPIGTTVIPVLTPSSGTSVQRIDNIGVDSADRFSFTYRWAKISPAGVSYLINVNYIVVAITGLPY